MEYTFFVGIFKMNFNFSKYVMWRRMGGSEELTATFGEGDHASLCCVF